MSHANQTCNGYGAPGPLLYSNMLESQANPPNNGSGASGPFLYSAAKPLLSSNIYIYIHTHTHTHLCTVSATTVPYGFYGPTYIVWAHGPITGLLGPWSHPGPFGPFAFTWVPFWAHCGSKLGPVMGPNLGPCSVPHPPPHGRLQSIRRHIYIYIEILLLSNGFVSEYRNGFEAQEPLLG